MMYIIQARNVISYYHADSEEEALEKFAKDRRFDSYQDMVERRGKVDSIDQSITPNED